MSPARRKLIDRIVSDFAPRHAKSARVLRTALKSNWHRLEEIGINPTSASILPDVILDDTERGWLFLIDAATPFSPPSGLATGSFNGLHTKSKFLAAPPPARGRGKTVMKRGSNNRFHKSLRDLGSPG